MRNYILPFALGMSMSMVILSRAVGEYSGRQQSDDRHFVKNTLEDGIAEVMYAYLALEQSGSAQVRKYAQMIVAHHQKANNQLKNILKKKRYGAIPDSPSASAQESYQKINALSGAEFDQAFAQQMVENHEKNIHVFQRQIENGKDKELTAWARKNLPALKKHLEHAQNLDKMLSES